MLTKFTKKFFKKIKYIIRKKELLRTFEYIVDKNKTKKLNDEDAVVKLITSRWDNWNSARSSSLKKAEELKEEIYFLKAKKEQDDNPYTNWKSNARMCKCYMFYQTLKAFIWKNVYANPNSMFDVAGENLESDNNSTKQKVNICNILDKMEFTRICDNIIDNALLYGELITFVAWKKKQEEYRKKIGLEDLVKPEALAELTKGHFHYVATKDVYDNPYVYAVNPANFVFDVAQKDNWDDCPKIYRTFKTPDDIINNKYYKVSDECKEYIRELAKSNDDNINKSDENDDCVNGSTVEVLEHWGNFSLQDGTVLKNWHAVIVARKYIVRFERNNRIVNPFTYGTFVCCTETKRGISPLFCTVELAQMQETMMNRTVDMQALNENPPVYSPTGFFENQSIKLYPGKVIEYGDELSPSDIQQMTFNDGVYTQNITYLSDLMAEISGVFPNMAGADEKGNKTATEISTKAQGQLTRLSMLIDIINQDLIVPVIKNIAKLCADFKSGNEEVLTTNGDNKETLTITDDIRKGEYKYTYSDRTATTERSNKADLVVNALKEFAQFVPLKADEIMCWYLEQKDVENPERFIQRQAQIPDEIQQQLLQDPQIAQIIELYNQGQAEEEKGDKEPPKVIPEASVPESQPME